MGRVAVRLCRTCDPAPAVSVQDTEEDDRQMQALPGRPPHDGARGRHGANPGQGTGQRPGLKAPRDTASQPSISTPQHSLLRWYDPTRFTKNDDQEAPPK